MSRTAADALLRTLEAKGMSLTLERDPTSTIDPRSGEGSSSDDRALADHALEALRGRTERERYLPLEVLGEGGMGVVWLGRQRSLERLVALKSLKRALAGPHARLKLLREARITGRLEHPNIVPVHDLGVDGDGEPQIVLKRIDGTTWGELSAAPAELERRFGASDALEWNLRVMIEVARAVHFAHTRGVIHRDLKPENVMIGQLGEVYVVDWGLAVGLEDDETGLLTRADLATDIAGTPNYMAPEQWGSPEGVDVRTDVYLLGATLFEVLVGRPPREGQTILELASQAMELPEVPDAIPAELAGVVLGAMQPERSARYGSADAFRRAIETFLERRGSIALAREAELKLARLEALLAARPIDRVAAYQIFGAVRFGFLEALRSWDTNATARRGLSRAARAMLEYELADGDPLSAQALLADLPRDAALAARVEDAVRRRTEERETLRATRRLFDPNVGRAARWWVLATAGAFWTLSPLVAGALRERAIVPDTLGFQVLGNVAVLVSAFFFFRWALGVMGRTAINRSTVGVLLVALTAQLLVSLGSWLAHLTDVALVHYFAVWSCAAGAAAVTIDRRLAPTMIAYAACFLVGSLAPDYRYWLAAAGNLTLALNTTFLWSRPEGESRELRQQLRKLRRTERR